MIQETSKRKRLAVAGIAFSAGVVFASAFLSWVTMAFSLKEAIHDPGSMSNVITGWNGSMELFGLSIPHWVVVFSAILPFVLVLLRQFQLLALPAFVSYILAGYGFVHSALIIVYAVTSSHMSPGLGPVLATAGFVGLIAGLQQYYKDK